MRLCSGLLGGSGFLGRSGSEDFRILFARVVISCSWFVVLFDRSGL